MQSSSDQTAAHPEIPAIPTTGEHIQEFWLLSCRMGSIKAASTTRGLHNPGVFFKVPMIRVSVRKRILLEI